MITVEQHANKLVIKGHAGSADYGKDLVCASASILFYTLIANLHEVELEGDCKVVVKESSGDCEVAVCACNEATDKVMDIFHYAMNGYRLLAENYPKNLQILKHRNFDIE